MSLNNYVTNLFDGKTSHGTLASNGRASIVKTDEGRIYVIIDGVKYFADRNDLFGINENPAEWLLSYVKEHDKKAKLFEFNAPLEAKIDKIEQKMKKNSEAVKKSQNRQMAIKAAIKNTKKKLSEFLEQCGVTSRSMLTGDKKAHADSLYETVWDKRFSLTSESNLEYSLLTDNCLLAFDKGKAARETSFNNVILENIYT